MSPRDRWLDEGLAALRDEGPSGVRIDPIAARLGLTKGSFHHHFAGVAGYRSALLACYEQQQLSALADIESATGSLAPRDALMVLPVHLRRLFDQRLEVAIRAWAAQDAEARAASERVDHARLAILESFWSRIINDPARARTAALIPHLLLIGSSVTSPPVDRTQLQRIFDLLTELAPAVR